MVEPYLSRVMVNLDHIKDGVFIMILDGNIQMQTLGVITLEMKVAD